MSESSSKEQRETVLDQMTSFFVRVERNALMQTPDQAEIEFEDVEFLASDGVKLKGWIMPAKESKKLVIFNHFMIGNRAGAQPHPDWGNVKVDFMPIYKNLIDAGYSVFSYDLRNHGESEVFQDGKLGLTHTEYQDVIGAIRYANVNFSEHQIFLYSQCYGTVSTIRAMEKSPNDFEGIRAFVNIQPLTGEGYVLGSMAYFNMEHEENLAVFDRLMKQKTGFGIAESSVPADAVKIPTLSVQVKDDWRTTNESILDIHDRFATDDKKLFWIEGETERLEGYNYFAKNPDVLLDWLNTH